MLVSVLVMATLGCRENAESPTAPETGPALDIMPVHALSFRQVSAGLAHTCGMTPDNKAYCWGNNFYGQLGDNTTTQRLTPVRVVGGLRFRQVSAGSFHTCGVTTGTPASRSSKVSRFASAPTYWPVACSPMRSFRSARASLFFRLFEDSR